MNSHWINILLAVGTAAFLCGSIPAEEKIPAFPGAEGFGAYTTGGRGGKVLVVTNLEDYLPGMEEPVQGSLRKACYTRGPRIIVFRVSGTIPLKKGLVIKEPFLTIAGQTSPGGGICLKNHATTIATNDVVIRHLRFRVGDEPASEYHKLGGSFQPDALTMVAGSRNVVIDHCSASWAIDETISVSGEGITDVTVQWCIISESLNQSAHSKGKHGYGSLLRCNGNVTFHHNLYAQHSSRCPRPGTYGEGSILLDFRNNVIFNGKGYSSKDPVRMNYCGNYIHMADGLGFYIGGDTTKVFAVGNFQAGAGAANDNQWNLLGRATEASMMDRPFETAHVETETAQQAFGRVLAQSGATKPARDAVDQRVVADVRQGTFRLIDSQSEVGGWPELRVAPPPTDSDADGMPNDWEKRHGLNPHLPDDTADPDKDGYTNIEEFLNETAPQVPEVGTSRRKDDSGG
jgi:pectate lyase